MPCVTMQTDCAALTNALADFKARVAQAQADIMRQNAQELGEGLKSALSAVTKDIKGRNEPSAPGEAPAKVTGLLQESVKAQLTRSDGQVTILAGDTEGRAPYGMYLEYGTLNVLPRPWLLPLFAEYSQKLKKAFARIGEVL